MLTLKDIKDNREIKTYIQSADATLGALGFTEHSLAHMAKCAETIKDILSKLGYTQREIEIAQIAGYVHDIGNMVNRKGHAQSGAIIVLGILEKLGMPPEEISVIVSAVGHHDEETAFPVNWAAAALILADKSDVRRSRVRNTDMSTFDIHDRVNYAVEKSELKVSIEKKTITLDISIDNNLSTVMEYFEIFIARMQLCRQAANFFNYQFKLIINETIMI